MPRSPPPPPSSLTCVCSLVGTSEYFRSRQKFEGGGECSEVIDPFSKRAASASLAFPASQARSYAQVVSPLAHSASPARSYAQVVSPVGAFAASPARSYAHVVSPVGIARDWPYDQSSESKRWSRSACISLSRSPAKPAVAASPCVFTQPQFRDIDEFGLSITWPWEQQQRQEAHLAQNQLPPHRTDKLVSEAMNASMADGNMGRTSTGVKHWHAFCQVEGLTPNRPLDPNASLQQKLLEEQLCMRFCAALVEDRNLVPSTIATYMGQVQGWHSKEHGIRLCAGLKLSRLPAMLKGLRRILGDTPQAIRRGIAPQMLRKAFDLCLDPAVPAHANIRAALALALQGLLRGSEFAVDEGKVFNPKRHLTRADVRVLTDSQLVVMMLPCKNMRHLNGKTVPLAVGAGGEFVDAVAEMRNLLRVDPTPDGAAAKTPLFRDVDSNQPLRTGALRRLLQSFMLAIGEAPSEFGLHSLRIGGATALFAAGATPIVIRTMGRWSSDCYRLYVRACYEQTLYWSSKCGSTPVRDLAGQWCDEVSYY